MKKSNNLKDLRYIFPVASAKPGNSVVRIGKKFNVHNHIQIEDYPDESIIIKLIKDVYEDNQKYVNDLFQFIYNKPVSFSDKLSDILIKIKKFMNQVGKTIEEVVSEIRKYLGYNCSFHRYYKGKLIPCNSERILKAYNLVKERKSLLSVEDCLYL